MKIKRKYINLIVDAIAYAAFIFLVTTGFLMRYTLPPGSGHQATLWGLDRHAWGDVHFWVSIGFLGILVLHLVLHWKWIFAVISGKPRSASGSRFVLGAISAIGITLIGIAPFFSDIESSTGRNHLFRRNQIRSEYFNRQGAQQELQQKQKSPRNEVVENNINSKSKPIGDETSACIENTKKNDINIAGYMTLKEVEGLSGAPAAYILSELKLPPDTPVTERLGRLKRTYHFEVADVRRAVQNYQLN